jgi:membrane-bound lytic murein transglycosylase MltF
MQRGTRIITLALVLSCLAGVTSCSQDDGGRTAQTASKLSHPLDAHFEERYTDDLPGIIKRKYLRVLTTMNRTNFFIESGQAYGFEYSLLKDYEKYLNRSVSRKNLQIVVEFIPVARDELISGLLEGRGDIAAAGLTITAERKKLVDFTDPYLEGIEEVVVAHKSVAGKITGPADLSGREVLVRPSSSYFESLVSLNNALKKEGLEPVDIEEAPETLETEDILEMVNSGAVPLTISDSHIAGIWSKGLPDIRVIESAAIRRGGHIAWMVRKNSPELKKSLNRFIKTRRQGTLIGNIYFNRYFKNTKWIKNPRGSGTTKMDRLFQRYGKQYGFDWMLLKAMAFQESGMDPNRRSTAGAVGLMQVRPATAADERVAIKEFRGMDGNIHAGTKYLAFLEDRYFSDPGLRERDRVRFALAAYNAGPAKVQEARRLAARMGLDPDRWFRNVEIAMLRLVGSETVRYVSNINKYYILFKREYVLNQKREEAREEIL